MAKKVLHFQQNSLQNDTIKPIDSTGTEESFTQKVFRYNKDNQKDTLIKLIEQGYDATSYIYSIAGGPVPLSDNFLNPEYFKVYNQPIGQTAQNYHTEKSENATITSDTSSENQILSESDYMLVVLLLFAAAIGFVRVNTKDFLNRLFNSVVSFSFSRIMYNERNRLFQFNDLILLSVFYISSGILIVALSDYYRLNITLINKFVTSIAWALVIFVFVQAYKLLISFIGVFIEKRRITFEYLFYLNNILKLLAILNVIILFGIFFAPENNRLIFVLSIYFIYLIVYLLRDYKIISIFLINRFSLFYLILYFCALEIVPILMFGKFFLGINQNRIILFDLLF